MRFVENHERIVKRPAAHERQRRDFDGPALDHFASAVEVDHVMQRVIEWAQIRIDLFRQIAGQKTEFFAGFDRRPGENDAHVIILHQLGHGHRHGEIGLAGAGGTDAKDDVVAADGIDISFLRDAFRRDRALVRGYIDRVEKDILQLGAVIAAQDADRVVDVAGVNRIAFFQKTVELAQNLARQLDLQRVAFDLHRRAAHADFEL